MADKKREELKKWQALKGRTKPAKAWLPNRGVAAVPVKPVQESGVSGGKENAIIEGFGKGHQLEVTDATHEDQAGDRKILAELQPAARNTKNLQPAQKDNATVERGKWRDARKAILAERLANSPRFRRHTTTSAVSNGVQKVSNAPAQSSKQPANNIGSKKDKGQMLPPSARQTVVRNAPTVILTKTQQLRMNKLATTKAADKPADTVSKSARASAVTTNKPTSRGASASSVVPAANKIQSASASSDIGKPRPAPGSSMNKPVPNFKNIRSKIDSGLVRKEATSENHPNTATNVNNDRLPNKNTKRKLRRSVAHNSVARKRALPLQVKTVAPKLPSTKNVLPLKHSTAEPNVIPSTSQNKQQNSKTVRVSLSTMYRRKIPAAATQVKKIGRASPANPAINSRKPRRPTSLLEQPTSEVRKSVLIGGAKRHDGAQRRRSQSAPGTVERVRNQSTTRPYTTPMKEPSLVDNVCNWMRADPSSAARQRHVHCLGVDVDSVRRKTAFEIRPSHTPHKVVSVQRHRSISVSQPTTPRAGKSILAGAKSTEDASKPSSSSCKPRTGNGASEKENAAEVVDPAETSWLSASDEDQEIYIKERTFELSSAAADSAETNLEQDNGEGIKLNKLKDSDSEITFKLRIREGENEGEEFSTSVETEQFAELDKVDMREEGVRLSIEMETASYKVFGEHLELADEGATCENKPDKVDTTENVDNKTAEDLESVLQSLLNVAVAGDQATDVTSRLEALVLERPEIEEMAAYWECRIAVAGTVAGESVQDLLKNAAVYCSAEEIKRMKRTHGYSEDRTQKCLDESDITEEFVTPRAGRTPRRAEVDPDKMFKSSTIKYSLRSNTPSFKKVLEPTTEKVVIATPVRRTTRSMSRVTWNLTQAESIVNSLKEVPLEFRKSMIVRANPAILSDDEDGFSPMAEVSDLDLTV